MENKVVIHNIKVHNILTILNTFQSSDFIDFTLVPGSGINPDTIRISPSGFTDSNITEWFDLKRINDFI